MDTNPYSLLPLYTIRTAVTEIGDRVSQALKTQVGDVARLQAHRNECLRLMIVVQQVCSCSDFDKKLMDFNLVKHASIISLEEIITIESNLQSMISHLDAASHISADPPDPGRIETTRLIYSGRPGRPRIEINPDLLAASLRLRGTTHLAPVFNTCARTVRRRALEYGIVEPGPPVYIDYEAEDGSTFRVYSSSTASMSNLSDNDLDAIMRHILETFPSFGRRMIDGHLQHMGHRIPRDRLRALYIRVHPPTATFGSRRIERRVYSVAGPNSLAHHDGQHGKFYFFPILIQADLYVRFNTVEDCNTCFYRWILQACDWNSC